MIRFDSDYAEGAHERILQRLLQTNEEQTPGYGEDAHCKNAARLILEHCGRPDAQVHFLMGGTQANLTVIAAALRPHQGVICAQSGHINGHEAGAIEATGHKVLALPSADGKLTAGQVDRFISDYYADVTHEHIVQPGMVFISQPTENGTIYQKAELKAIRSVCDRWGILLYLDGARLGYALGAKNCDTTIADLAALCDAFYIGGTKMGALFGEAVVLCNPILQRDFRSLVKQRGGLLAKGRLLGIQFEVLLEDGLYFELGRRAVEQAARLRTVLEQRGIPMLFDATANQQFPILPDEWLKSLSDRFSFAFWQRVDEGHGAVRFCTSWATKPEQMDALCAAILAL